ncbi:hypothetical protein PCYB_092400 [Plasmodium cynomolgi strain B]|uniref:Uncharacterized protein n=1 Tax=Plasmodium cynomolgi (strain B) TaxID=1120755 RepID=K6UT54_PLACD|nr:hypothetical protein PCYB_092400 [Plasmodium cynomolgi strain B]GAB66454.1 hypothetical protein PCYB_092400 [Plasmodium cynomolgi strain B]
MLSAKNKFEIARNRSCSSIRENLMCSSVILKNSSCLLKSSPAFENTTQLERRGEVLQDDMGSTEEGLLREKNAKELYQYLYTNGVNPDDGVIFTSNEWGKDHDVNKEFKKGILYDKVVMSNRTYNTAVDSVHRNFQTNKLENVVNSIKFEENTSIKIPSYLRSSPLHVLYPELDYLQGAREEAQPGGRGDAGGAAEGAEGADAADSAQAPPLPKQPLPQQRESHLAQNKNLNSYLRYSLNNSHTTGRNRMYDYFESNKKNMVEIANPNDLNHTLLYTKKNSPTELILNLYKNRYVTSSSNHTDNELNTLNTLKRLKMPIIEKNEKGENIVAITSEVNAKRRVNLLENGDTSKERNAEGAKQVSRGGKPNYTVSLIDMTSTDKASLKTVYLNNDKTGGGKKNFFQLKKKTHKDVQVQTNNGDFEQAAEGDVDSDVERVLSILEGKKKKASSEDTQVRNSTRKGEKGKFYISYCDLKGPGESGEETPTRSDDSGEADLVGEADEVNEADEADEADEVNEADEGGQADQVIGAKTERHANPNADTTACKSVSQNGHPRMTQAMQKYNQFLRTRRSRGRLNGTVLKEQLREPRRSGPFIGGEAHLKGAKTPHGSGNDRGKEPSGWDGSPSRRYNPMDKITMGWSSPLAGGRPPLYLGGNTNKAILIPKVSPPWVQYAPGEAFTSASFTGSKFRRENSPADNNAVTYDPSIGKLPDVCPNELRHYKPKPSRVCMYIKNGVPGGCIQRCDIDRSGEERKHTTASDEECEKEKITNDLLLKKLYIEKKRQLYEKRKFERAIASMLERRAALRERARDKYSGLVSLHGGANVVGHGEVADHGEVANHGDGPPSSAEWKRATLLRTLRCARSRPGGTYKRARGSGSWRDTTQWGHEKGHVSSCSNVNLYSSNEESDGGFGKRTHNAARNCSAQDGRRGVASQLAEPGQPGESGQAGEQNWVNTISPRTPIEEAIKGRRSDKSTNEWSNGGGVHKSIPKISPKFPTKISTKFSPKFSPKSWRGRGRRCAADDKRLRSMSYKNRVSTLSVLEKSIQSLKEHAKRNIIRGGNKSDEESDIIRREIKRCVERGGYEESDNETEDEPSGGSTDAGKTHLVDENKFCENDQKGGIKITYNLGRIVEKRGNCPSHEWVHAENNFISPINDMKGLIDENQYDCNEDQMDEHSCKGRDSQTEHIHREGDSYLSIRRDEKRETSPAEKKNNTIGISSVTNGEFQNRKTNESDNLFRVKITIKKADERGKELDKGSSNMEEGSNPNHYVLHENVQSMGSSSYKENASNGCIKRTGLVPKEKGNFSDTEVATRKRNAERLTKKGDESNDHPRSKAFLRKNDGHGGGDYLKIKKKEFANMRSHSHSKFSNQAEGSRETLPGIEVTSKCNSPLCRGRSNETNQVLDLERIDPNKWIQKIFGDTH